jgi:hypothetical protein
LGNNIVGTDGIPEYMDFNGESWADYLSDNRQSLIYDFRQALNIRVIYETNAKNEYMKAHNTGSRTSRVAPVILILHWLVI